MITRKATAERQTVTEGDRDRRECVRSEVEVGFKRGARTDAADHADKELGGDYPVLLARDSGGGRQRHVLVGVKSDDGKSEKEVAADGRGGSLLRLGVEDEMVLGKME